MVIRKSSETIIRLENENKMLKEKVEQSRADLDYVAMMTDVNIPEDEREVENE